MYGLLPPPGIKGLSNSISENLGITRIMHLFYHAVMLIEAQFKRFKASFVIVETSQLICIMTDF